jgi:hypothetical protein
MDVLSHLPVLCEDVSCPYLFVPSKESLGTASATKRPTSCIMMVMETDAAQLKGNKKAIEMLQAAKSDPEKAKEWDEYSAFACVSPCDGLTRAWYRGRLPGDLQGGQDVVSRLMSIRTVLICIPETSPLPYLRHRDPEYRRLGHPLVKALRRVYFTWLEPSCLPPLSMLDPEKYAGRKTTFSQQGSGAAVLSRSRPFHAGGEFET